MHCQQLTTGMQDDTYGLASLVANVRCLTSYPCLVNMAGTSAPARQTPAPVAATDLCDIQIQVLLPLISVPLPNLLGQPSRLTAKEIIQIGYQSFLDVISTQHNQKFFCCQLP